jgi:hypothetical protein
MSNTKLFFRVGLHVEPGDKFVAVHDCLAADADDAQEQAERAYPGCEVVTVLEFADVGEVLVIYSANESAVSCDNAGFWSNDNGWTELSGATSFTPLDMKVMNLPMALGEDAQWIFRELANASYGAPIVAI